MACCDRIRMILTKVAESEAMPSIAGVLWAGFMPAAVSSWVGRQRKRGSMIRLPGAL